MCASNTVETMMLALMNNELITDAIATPFSVKRMTESNYYKFYIKIYNLERSCQYDSCKKEKPGASMEAPGSLMASRTGIELKRFEHI